MAPKPKMRFLSGQHGIANPQPVEDAVPQTLTVYGIRKNDTRNDVQGNPCDSLLCFKECGEWNDLDILCKRVCLLSWIHNMNAVEF